MTEPTRQQIKEAFKKTIERWERMVEDVDYFHETECSLCLLEATDDFYVCTEFCPIRLHTSKSFCHGTPYTNFFRDKTPANALAELNFLRKVYIWWMEEGEKDKKWESLTGYKREIKEEKKEEWVDVTEEVDWRLHKLGHTFWVRGYYKNEFIVWLDNDGISRQMQSLYEIKVKRDNMSFNVLKKKD